MAASRRSTRSPFNDVLLSPAPGQSAPSPDALQRPIGGDCCATAAKIPAIIAAGMSSRILRKRRTCQANRSHADFNLCEGIMPAPTNALFQDAAAYEQLVGRWSRRLAPLLIRFG